MVDNSNAFQMLLRNISKSVLLCCVCLFGHSIFVSAQDIIAPSIINAAGGSTPLSVGTFDWSIGEMTLVNTYLSSSLNVTQGVLQPDSLHRNSVSIFKHIRNLSVYPNPTSALLQLSLQNDEPGKLEYFVLSADAKILQDVTTQVSSSGLYTAINLAQYPAGLYFLECRFESANGNKSATIFRISKN